MESTSKNMLIAYKRIINNIILLSFLHEQIFLLNIICVKIYS